MIPSRYRAEKKFKTILNKLSDDRDEHVRSLGENGESQCNLCGQKFTTKELTLDHLESVHNVHKEEAEDFGNSSSDEFDGKSNESSETDDESSGVDENEQSSNEYSDDDDNSNHVSFAEHSGRKPQTETVEIKFSRAVVQKYLDQELRYTKSTPRIAELNREL